MFALSNQNNNISKHKKIYFMKNIIRNTALALTLLLSATAAQAKSNILEYQQEVNENIGISIENAIGTKYQIIDSNGKVVYTGVVKLGKGNFKFKIGNNVVQEFAVL
jgi:hypothetical protein